MIWIIISLAAIAGVVLHRLALRRRRRQARAVQASNQQRWEKWQQAKRENGWAP